MQLNFRTKFNVLVTALIFTGCAAFEPGLRYQDMLRARQPTVKRVVDGLEVSVEEFASPKKSEEVFDADIAPFGVLPLLVKVENIRTETFQVNKSNIKAYLGGEELVPLSGETAANQAATSEYVGKALAWTLATGPFFIFLWPATIAGSASHTSSVNKRIRQHFVNLAFTDAALKPNQVAGGFLYFKIPDGLQKLEKLTVEVGVFNEQGGNKITSKLSLPTLELSDSVSAQEVKENEGSEEQASEGKQG